MSRIILELFTIIFVFKLYWLLGTKSKLSISNKLLAYKVILKPMWTYRIQLGGSASISNIEILWTLPRECPAHDNRCTMARAEYGTPTPLALCEAWSGALAVTGRLLISMAGDCSRSRLTALLLEKLLGVCLLFTGALSMGRAVQWSPMKPESWSGWFPTWVFADLLLSLVTLQLPERTARTPELHCSKCLFGLPFTPRSRIRS
jgi:hypothetical protein